MKPKKTELRKVITRVREASGEIKFESEFELSAEERSQYRQRVQLCVETKSPFLTLQRRGNGNYTTIYVPESFYSGCLIEIESA